MFSYESENYFKHSKQKEVPLYFPFYATLTSYVTELILSEKEMFRCMTHLLIPTVVDLLG